MPDLILNDEHEYFWKGERVPGVSDILEEAGYINSEWFSEEAALRGTNVHTATQFYDEDDLQWDSVLPEYESYVKAYARFRKDTGFKPILIESQSYSERFNYAGTLDRIGELGGILALVDIKTGAKAPFWALQLAAYARLKEQEYPNLVKHSLQLKSTGKYELSGAYTDPGDWEAFLHVLYSYHDKVKRGLVKL